MGYFDRVLQAVEQLTSTAGGLSNLYTGYKGVLYRNIPYTMLELGLYEIFKCSISMEIAVATVTGAVTAVLTTPLETVKMKMMTNYNDYVFFETALAAVDD